MKLKSTDRRFNLILFFLFLFTCIGTAFAQTSISTKVLTPTSAPISGLYKTADTTLRIASYNVYQSRIYKGNDNRKKRDRYDSWIRMVKAIRADIWVLQEMLYNSKRVPASYAEEFTQHMRDITGQNDWNYSSDLEGRLLLTRYKIKWNAEIIHRCHATWIELPADVSSNDILLVNVHYRNKTTRQAKQTMAFLDKVKRGNYKVDIPTDVSVIICGDFNASYNGTTYLTVKNKGYIDVVPRHDNITKEVLTHGRVTFRNGKWDIVPNKSKWTDKGRIIDFIFYKSSVLEKCNSFILNTLIMKDSVLNKYGLKRADVASKPEFDYNFNGNESIHCDHFPIIADFRIK